MAPAGADQEKEGWLMAIDTGAEILRQIQKEHWPWTVKNYGQVELVEGVLGLVEEHGEAVEAMADANGYFDAVGDTMIYAICLCSTMGWDVGELWEKRKLYEMPSRAWPVLVGRIAHAYVKGHIQNYRGTIEQHNESIKVSLATLFRFLEYHVQDMCRDLITITQETWREISQRDWTKDRTPPIRAKETIMVLQGQLYQSEARNRELLAERAEQKEQIIKLEKDLGDARLYIKQVQSARIAPREYEP